MDPGWPENPGEGVVCILCKSVLPFKGNPDNFFRHIMQDHNTYHNLNIVLELSLTQPYRDYGSGIGVEFIGPLSPPPDDLDISQEEEISIFVNDEEKYHVPLPEGPMDFSQLDPISFVNQIRPKTKVKMEQSDVNSQGTLIPLTNPNRHLVPEELQRLLVISNPDRSIKFTHSQRLNTQLVLDDFILKKKKGQG